jgi:hypothetical protein
VDEQTLVGRINLIEQGFKRLSELVIKLLDKNKNGIIEPDEWKQAGQSLKNSWYLLGILGLNIGLSVWELATKTTISPTEAIWMLITILASFSFTLLKGVAEKEMNRKQISWNLEMQTLKADYYKLSTQFVEANAQITIRDAKIQQLQTDLAKK